MRSWFVASILLMSTTATWAATPLEQHEARVAKYARGALDLKPKGLCMCTQSGVLKGATGELVRSLNLDVSDFRVGILCKVPRFNTATGERTAEDLCTDFEFVGK